MSTFTSGRVAMAFVVVVSSKGNFVTVVIIVIRIIVSSRSATNLSVEISPS